MIDRETADWAERDGLEAPPPGGRVGRSIPAEVEASDAFEPTPIGAYLRRQRILRGVTIEELCAGYPHPVAFARAPRAAESSTARRMDSFAASSGPSRSHSDSTPTTRSPGCCASPLTGVSGMGRRVEPPPEAGAWCSRRWRVVGADRLHAPAGGLAGAGGRRIRRRRASRSWCGAIPVRVPRGSEPASRSIPPGEIGPRVAFPTDSIADESRALRSTPCRPFTAKRCCSAIRRLRRVGSHRPSPDLRCGPAHCDREGRSSQPPALSGHARPLQSTGDRRAGAATCVDGLSRAGPIGGSVSSGCDAQPASLRVGELPRRDARSTVAGGDRRCRMRSASTSTRSRASVSSRRSSSPRPLASADARAARARRSRAAPGARPLCSLWAGGEARRSPPDHVGPLPRRRWRNRLHALQSAPRWSGAGGARHVAKSG